jgi:hypothetical protein
MAKLIGTDPNQVPTNGDLGDLAYQNKDSVKIEGGEITADSITTATLNTTGDITFGDNDKAIFGAGSDLQIYHTGTNSFIRDVGTGDLRLCGDNLQLRNAATTESYIQCAADDAVTLYYDNSAKLATTSTGIDVTGTVTADGLTVDGTTTTQINGSNYTYSGTNYEVHTLIGSSGGGVRLGQDSVTHASLIGTTGSNDLDFVTYDGSSWGKRAKIQNNGDISFYEDTGTTPKFFWDASAESLGIGTSSPADKLSLEVGSANSGLSIYYSGTEIGSFRNDAANLTINANNASLKFATGGTERMRIDSSGNVTIGGNTAWHAGNDGSGSGLDADTLDGSHASAFAASSHTHTGLLTNGVTYSTSKPTYTSNPSSVGHLWIETDTGLMYVCTDNTTNDNYWKNVGAESEDIQNIAAYYTATYTSGSGTINIPSNAGNVRVTLWGGGGGGGQSHDLNCPYGNVCGCDGADGGSAQRTISGIAGTSVAYSVGAGGAGSGGTWYASGSAGGTTSFGSYASATGGGGGGGSPAHNSSCTATPSDGSGGSYDIANDGSAGQGGTKGCSCGTASGTAGTAGKFIIEWGVGV